MIKIFKAKLKTNLLGKFVFSLGTIVFLFFPLVLNAEIIITEIMYNPEGSDTGKEWLEIYNKGEAVDLTGWKLFEAETNHKINPAEEGKNLNFPANSYAIIVDNFEKFKENYSSFSGLVFDSAYSLSNTGETLIIRDNDLNDIDSVNYSVDSGADGDGNSLQLINNSWVSANPTIGETNNFSETQEPPVSSSETSEVDNANNSTTDFPIEPQIFADAGKDRKIIVGADTMFNAKGFGIEREPLQNARYSWSFGDGGLKEGQNILYTYKYPSKYVVVLNVSSGEHTANDRIIVEALPADIIISEVNSEEGFIELYNRSKYELNLSWWRIRSEGQYFSLPKDTIILPDNKIRVSSQITKLNYLNKNQIYLLYPNGEVVNKYSEVEQFISSSSSLRAEGELRTESSEPYIQGKINSKPETLNTKQTQNEQNLNFDKRETEGSEFKDQLAFAGGIKQEERGLFNKWFFYLLGVVLLSVVGVLFTKGLELKTDENLDKLKPEDFKIID
ncbi:lamin tail domain-containing protein [Patescibacteria group bacterium]|nr:lamin tail domain-containing protein [Patescibacteria group bacterium]